MKRDKPVDGVIVGVRHSTSISPTAAGCLTLAPNVTSCESGWVTDAERPSPGPSSRASAEDALSAPVVKTFEDAVELAHTQLTVYQRPPDEAALVMGNDYGYDLDVAKRAVAEVQHSLARAKRRWTRNVVVLTAAVIAGTAAWHFTFGARAGTYLVAALAFVGGNLWMVWLHHEARRM